MHDIQLRSDERRRQPRSGMLGLAKINLLGPDLLMHCVVIDWSHGGARLELENTSLCPDSFILIGADDWFEDCRVAWRKDNQIGVQFLKGVNPDAHFSPVRREGEAAAKAMNQIPFPTRGDDVGRVQRFNPWVLPPFGDDLLESFFRHARLIKGSYAVQILHCFIFAAS